MMKIIGFKIGSPTVKEFLDRYIEELNDPLLKSDKFQKICMYIAKMTCHNYSLMQLPTSLLAAAVVNVGLRIYEKIEPKLDVSLIMNKIV